MSCEHDVAANYSREEASLLFRSGRPDHDGNRVIFALRIDTVTETTPGYLKDYRQCPIPNAMSKCADSIGKKGKHFCRSVRLDPLGPSSTHQHEPINFQNHRIKRHVHLLD
ncbi:hypothetical protein Pst134EA_019301 [Puccinia striiformis f. sp. tritici]|uniref:hypothetical protein n=1 Tax=Puccinia striiformis f. sp. tritici TaxID=168172 RepID=UPI002007AC68|nr:hypothetical protein Pst134EA_019301 [Puccinia striiformis f. sp. tritici]KAH9459146.1 hypothetical protein Pst134EA_019301 [Puccinia striiformis f. sp. tritici]